MLGLYVGKRIDLGNEIEGAGPASDWPRGDWRRSTEVCARIAKETVQGGVARAMRTFTLIEFHEIDDSENTGRSTPDLFLLLALQKVRIISARSGSTQ